MRESMGALVVPETQPSSRKVLLFRDGLMRMRSGGETGARDDPWDR